MSRRGASGRILLIGAIGTAIELAFGLFGLALGVLPLGVGVLRLIVAPVSLLWLANPEAAELTGETAIWALCIALANGLLYATIAGFVLLVGWAFNVNSTRRS